MIRSIKSFDLRGQTVLIRLDLNVPLHNEKIEDDFRITACIPTINYALKNNAKILLVSHLGRPTESVFEDKFSLKPVAACLSEIIDESVEVVDQLDSKKIFNSTSRVQILENIRFFKGEKDNSDELGRMLGSLGHIYVFDAFGTAHRKQASTHSAIKHASLACAGLLMEKENSFLSQALNVDDRPYLAVIGGAKVSTKLELIKHISDVADHIIVGGGIANTFLKASGKNIGTSLVEDSMLDVAKNILNQKKIILPKRVVTSKTFEGENVNKKSIHDILESEMILDACLEQEVISLIHSAKTILWNGPMGVFENIYFEESTRELAKAIATSEAFSIAGGGETLSAINKYIKSDDVSYCSTGGGAFLEFMEGKVLPSIEVLNSKEIGS